MPEELREQVPEMFMIGFVSHALSTLPMLLVSGLLLVLLCKSVGQANVVIAMAVGLAEKDKQGLDAAKAVKLMQAQPSMIKRPVLEAGGALLIGFALDAALPDGRTPRIHQREGTLQMMRLMRLILGWEMGTGKTLAALLVGKMLYEREGWHTLVICRANLCENWRREASGCGHRIVSVFAHAKIPETHSAPFILVNDEAHDFQSMKSQRRRSVCAGPVALSQVQLSASAYDTVAERRLREPQAAHRAVSELEV